MAKKTQKKQTEHSQEFQAEVGRLLDIVTHALYSEREIFLRELISNAADACDRLRYQAISKPELIKDGQELGITLHVDKEAGILTVEDNGIGMSAKELTENLGTIARSGTREFMAGVSGDAKKDINLIGQFGVGFYASFMVADEVTVVSTKAGDAKSNQWQSDGKTGFKVSPEKQGPDHGTVIRLKLKEDASEFFGAERIKHIVTTYSNHIAFPIRLHISDGEEGDENEQINRGAAPWTLAPSKMDEEQHKEFYRHVSHGFDEPWGNIHFRAEGMLEYSALLYIPSERPFDLFNPERLNRVKLYVKRVFITDQCEQLLPSWLRFMRGVVDSEDLPLNVSREMLQNNPVISKISKNLVGRVLDLLTKRAKEDEEGFNQFWEKFGVVVKEGLCDFAEDKARLLSLVRFKSIQSDKSKWVSLEAYKDAMVKGQKAIYYISGEDEASLMASPHLEGFKAKSIDVLLFTDPVDEFWVGYVGEYDGIKLQSVTRAGADLDDMEQDTKTDQIDSTKEEQKSEAKKSEISDEQKAVLDFMKTELKEHISDVKLSTRLTESPACLVASEFGPDLHLERLLKQHKQLDQQSLKQMEINPNHPLILHLTSLVTDQQDQARDIVLMLHDQARIIDGEPPVDSQAFAKRLSAFMTRPLETAS